MKNKYVATPTKIGSYETKSAIPTNYTQNQKPVTDKDRQEHLLKVDIHAKRKVVERLEAREVPKSMTRISRLATRNKWNSNTVLDST